MKKNQIIVVSGAKEGVGKTAFAVNFATHYSIVTKKPVVILDLDRGIRGDSVNYLNAPTFETVENLYRLVRKVDVEKSDLGIFKGRLSFSDKGISLLKIAGDKEKAKEINIAQILKIIAIFSNFYTFVIDIENMDIEWQTPIFDMADFIFWLVLPYARNMEYTKMKFGELRSLKFNLDKFGIVLNQNNLEEGLSLRQINTYINEFQKGIIVSIPREKVVTKATHNKQTVVTEQPHAEFSRSVRTLTELIINREKKEIGKGKGNIWRSLVEGVQEEGQDSKEQEAVLKDHDIETRMREVKETVHKNLIEDLNARKIDINNLVDNPEKEQEIHHTVEESATKILSSFGDTGFTRAQNDSIIKEVLDDALGLGPLEDILRDKSITEIMVNKKDQIYIEQKGKLKILDKKFMSNDQIVQVIRRIISPLGRRIDESMPLVDARLKDGSRVNAIIPPLAVQGPMITIRRFPEKVLKAEDLIGFGSITKDMVDFLRAAVICEKNIIVSGGTGSGKTTFLNMLSNYVSKEERILTIEDVAELQLQQEHLGRLESRPPNIEGKGEITIRDLVKNTLRMRPDRIIVGECRGGESLDMLQAMNTGHEGSMTTIHANNPRDMIGRLEAMVLMSGSELPIPVIRGYIASAVNLIVQIGRMQDGSRKVVAVTEVLGKDENNNIKMQDIFLYKRKGVDKTGKVMGNHEGQGVIPKCAEDFKIRGLDIKLDIFKKKK